MEDCSLSHSHAVEHLPAVLTPPLRCERVNQVDISKLLRRETNTQAGAWTVDWMQSLGWGGLF